MLTVSQSIVPVLVPFRLDIMGQRLKFSGKFTVLILSGKDNSSRVVHNSSDGTLKVIANSSKNQTRCFGFCIILYL